MAKGKGVKKRLEACGHAFFYTMLFCFGQTGAYLFLWPVIGSYILGSRRIHHLVMPYLKRRFPGQGWWQSRVAAFKIVHSFGKVLVDRAWLGLKQSAALNGTFAGEEQVCEVLNQGRGVVLLIAHVGNWQSALAHISRLPVKVHSLMQYEQEAVAKHYFDLGNGTCPFNIIRSDGFLGGMVECTAALQRGEVVTIMGDRYAGGPHVTVDFFDSPVRLPVGAYSLAAATGAAVVVLFAAKTGKTGYELRVWDLFTIHHGDRDEKRAEMGRAAKRFVNCLERYLEQYPYQWYNFFDFWKQ